MLPARLLSMVVARLDLRRRLRAPGSSQVLTFYLSGLGIVVAAFLLRQIDPPADESAHPGFQLLQVLALYQLALLLVLACLTTSTSITDERSGGTWDLLLLSRMSSLGLLFNKLIAGLTFNWLLLVASLPLYSIISLLYGISVSAIARVCLVFLATALVFSSAGVAISVVSSRSTTAKPVAAVAAIAYGGLSLLGLLRGISTAPGPLAVFLQVSPFAAVVSAFPPGAASGLLHVSAMLNGVLGTSLRVPLWAAYSAVAALVSALLLLGAAPLLRSHRISGFEVAKMERSS